METTELIDLLNRAIADEWMAHFQYWAGAQVAAGPLETRATEEFMQHAQDEYTHATALGVRVSRLRGRPPISFREVMINHFCGYMAPLNPLTLSVLDQNIMGESCAIGFYTELSERVKDFDPITFTLLQPILAKEKEHKADLEKIREAVQALMPHG